MVQFKKDEIRQFVSELENPDKLLNGCEKYREIDPRDIVYIVARKMILDNPNSEYSILAGIKVLLLIWNFSYYQNQPSMKQNLEEEIFDAYRNSKKDFDFLKGRKLESIDLRDSIIVGKIKRIFKTFSSYRSIKVTGASKAIHLINPDLFMMWDVEIKRNYHRLHPFFNIKAETTEECYIEFMKNVQKIVLGILRQRTSYEMWKMHPVNLFDPQLEKDFGQSTVRSLPKMIDECNFIKFRRGLDF